MLPLLQHVFIILLLILCGSFPRSEDFALLNISDRNYVIYFMQYSNFSQALDGNMTNVNVMTSRALKEKEVVVFVGSVPL